MNWIRCQMAGLCIRLALHILPKQARDPLARHLDMWMTELFDPTGQAMHEITVHRREVGIR